MAKATTSVFLYGDLCNSSVWGNFLKKASFVGTGKTKENFRLYDNVPVMVDGVLFPSKIIGKIYEIESQILENFNEKSQKIWYFRKEMPIYLNRKVILSWMYFYSDIKNILFEKANMLIHSNILLPQVNIG